MTQEVPKDQRKGCLIFLIFVVLMATLSVLCDEDKRSLNTRYEDAKRKADDRVLTKGEYEHKPFNELSEEEKRQAVDSIADELESSGVHVEGRNRDKDQK